MTTEKAGSQSHFIDLCRMLGEPTPHEVDPIGSQYAFEKRVAKAGGGDGFADVWKRGFFAWEYKGKDQDLKAAYVQLLAYKEAALLDDGSQADHGRPDWIEFDSMINVRPSVGNRSVGGGSRDA